MKPIRLKIAVTASYVLACCPAMPGENGVTVDSSQQRLHYARQSALWKFKMEEAMKYDMILSGVGGQGTLRQNTASLAVQAELDVSCLKSTAWRSAASVLRMCAWVNTLL